jgi:DNA repair exonuclease SbcCD ATPase subunit/predicted MPP superfamily phosphohydrolase
MKINVPFTKLETIVHLADIHVRLFKRHEEYRESFQTLYKQLRTVDLTNGVIVVAGDIVHAKTDMSPEMLLLASEFLSELADIAPTFIIAGNHDLNLSNMNRLDSLTPIIKNINHTNLHYLKHSGVYEVADTDFAVFSILDGKEEWPDITDCRQDISNKIALFHGPVHGAQTDARYTITNRHVENSTFDGFDMVLLGDIHKYQVLQERTSTQPIIVYSSSLIQQNHGETVNNHGWCLWNVTDRTHIFQELPNRFGYYTLEINDGKLAFPDDIPENVRLRLFTGNADTSVIKKAVASLRKKYNVIELSLNKSKNAGISGTSRRAENITEDVTNLNTQNTLIQDWIERHHENVDDELMKKIIAVNTALHSQVNHDDISRNIHWKPKKFTFSNMFSYGEDNEIDFADMQGLYGIFAQNASGKSSSMDALIFCLYDKTPRAFRGDHIMNNRRDTFECELEFEINEETYHIRRTGTRKKTGDVKVDVLFWKDAPDGSQLSLNGEDRRDTNSNIRNYVGSYEDFVLTALSSQTANALFIDKSHSERKDLLIQFMGLNIFDKMFDIAHDESKELSGALKKFKKTDFTQTLSDIQTKLDTTRIDHEKADMLFTDIKDARELLYTKLKTWQDKKLPLPNIELDLDKLQAKLDTNSKSLVGYEKKKELIANVILSTETQIQDKNTSIQQHNLKELDEDCILYDNLENVLTKGKSALKLTTAKITEKEKFKNKLESYKFNASCDICVENNKSHIDDLRTVTTELGLLTDTQQKQDSAIRDIEAQMIPLKERKAWYTQVQTWITETLNLQQHHRNSQSELETVTANIEKIQHQIEQIQKDIELHTINEDNIKHNLDVDTHISHIEFDIKTNKKQAEYLEKNLRELHGELKVLESTKQDIMRQITEAEELEDTFEAYKYYMDAVGRDGVPYELMSRAIPNIEAEINNILTQIAEFTISLEVEGKNIVGKLNYDHERIWPLENSSGMERFISSLAIRVALLNASNLPKSNFMIIDEGLGTLDAENLSSMSVLFGILKNQFDFLIIISHLDSARDMVDKVIEIKREDGFSYINV